MKDEGRLRGRRITVGVTGSIAAYKAPLVVRLLLKEGAEVRVVLSRSALEFVGASTFSGLTREPALTDMFDPDAGGERHVLLARTSDLVLVVPATADALSRFATGRADDLLAATVLSASCPVLVAPAMHPSMWGNPATAHNVDTLNRSGRIEFLGPVDGEVASGDRGLGRMLEPGAIVERVVSRFATRDLEARTIVVTAGPTVEDVDPVRFISNRSSGKMGFALAEGAASRGARVVLIAGPVALATPHGVLRVDVRSALEMQSAVHEALGAGRSRADALLMCAAVGDFRPKEALSGKLKREKRGGFSLELVQNPDILSEVSAARRGPAPLLVGFAVETGTDKEILANARRKLAAKGVDLVVANPAAESMGRDDNRVILVGKQRNESLPLMPKRDVAHRVLDWVSERLQTRRDSPPPGTRERREPAEGGGGSGRRRRAAGGKGPPETKRPPETR